MRNYIIRIVWTGSNQIEYIELQSEDIKWSMQQFSRNRKPFKWSIVKVED